MNIDNIEEVYRIVKYSFAKFDVESEFDAINIAQRFFKKYNENFSIKQIYSEFDNLEMKYHIYIAY